MNKNPIYDDEYVTLGYLKEYLGDDATSEEEVKYSKNYGSTPNPPYHKNDTWTSSEGIYVCIQERLSGNYVSSDWELLLDTKTINDYIIKEELSLPDLLKDTKDNKITTHVQLTDPSVDWDTAIEREQHIYDMWKMLEHSTSYIYVKYNVDPVAYGWVEIKDTVSDIWNLNGTKTIYGSKPTEYTAGDLWIIEEGATSLPESSSPGTWVYAINSNTEYDENDWSSDPEHIDQEKLEEFMYDKDPKLTEGIKWELSQNGRVVINGGNITAGSIRSNNYVNEVSGTKLDLLTGTIDTKNFKVDATGKIKATDGEFTGKLTSSSGNIGGFRIGQYTLVGGTGTSTVGMCSTTGQEYAFWAGASASSSAPFRVGHDGGLVTTKGTIGGVNIGTDTLYTGDCGLSSNTGKYAFWAGETNNVQGAASTNAKFKVGHDGILHAQNCVINGGTITGASSININDGSHWLSMGYGTGHPSVSGLNVSSAVVIGGKELSVNNGGSLQCYGDFQAANLWCGGTVYNNHFASRSNSAITIHAGGNDGSYANNGGVYIASGASVGTPSHITLNAQSGYGYVYAEGNGTPRGRVAIDSSGPSSRCLKENIELYTSKEFDESLKLLDDMDIYNYNYKYSIHPKENQYGFIIDDLLDNKLADKFLYFKDETAGINKSDMFDYSVSDDDNPDNLNIVHFKRYDEETLVKYLLVCCKAMNNKIHKLEEKYERD